MVVKRWQLQVAREVEEGEGKRGVGLVCLFYLLTKGGGLVYFWARGKGEWAGVVTGFSIGLDLEFGSIYI